MKYYNKTKETTLSTAEETFSFNLDYDAIHEGVLRGEEDIRCGRYWDLKKGMNKVKRMLLND